MRKLSIALLLLSGCTPALEAPTVEDPGGQTIVLRVHSKCVVDKPAVEASLIDEILKAGVTRGPSPWDETATKITPVAEPESEPSESTSATCKKEWFNYHGRQRWRCR